MKDQEYYIAKLLRLPEQFNALYYQKKYASAKYVYDTALRVCEFLEDVSAEVKHQLFGYGAEDIDDEDVILGMFDREMVSKCYEECAVKSDKGFENEKYRSFGQDPRYYQPYRSPEQGKASEKIT